MSNGRIEWLGVDPDGLARLLEKRGREWVVYELLQNAWDEDITEVSLELTPIAGRPAALLKVTDDSPEGFRDLSHAWTLFADSYKKGDAEKRGRFNLGEKLVLAICNWATITSTTGSVTFDANGRRRGRKQTERGTVFEAEVRVTRDQLREMLAAAHEVIAPVRTLINGEALPAPEPSKVFDATLPTEAADAEGNLIRTKRNARVALYAVGEDEVPFIHEMGIPVVELEGGERWHVDISQKVPLNMQRDNVTPAYLRSLRVALLNAVYEDLDKADASQTWAREAASDERVEDEAVTKAMTLRYGTKRVAFDPTDPEANAQAMAQGYTVIHGGSMSANEWRQAKRAGAALPAGRVTPSRKAYGDGDGDPVDVVEPAKYTPDQRVAVAYCKRICEALIDRPVSVRIVRTTNYFAAAWGGCTLDLNLRRLGHRWFKAVADGRTDECHDLMIHEVGHHYESNHLSEGYYNALTKLGARLARLALDKPELFEVD